MYQMKPYVSFLVLLNMLFGSCFCFFQTLGEVAQPSVFDVRGYGAKADSVTDDSIPLLAAWKAACSSSSAAGPVTVRVPNGRYLVSPLTFKGPCKNPISFQLFGSILAPTGADTYCRNYWINFNSVHHLTVEGNGLIDGRDSSFWSMRKQGRISCAQGPTSLKFSSTTNTVVRGITSLNSKQMHIKFDGCRDVKVQHLTIRAPADSPNTDGVHIGDSSNVKILDVNIATGDDCVSIGPGSFDLIIKRVTCGPGHGISIGSLGKYTKWDAVRNVTVSQVILKRTENGVRIKTWEGGNGEVSGFVFENVKMKNVQNPIVIDQHYCPHSSGCTVGDSAGVKIRDVVYKNITGVSATEAAVALSCSKTSPCQGIKMIGVHLSSQKQGQAARSVCKFAKGSAIGLISPPPCL